MADKPRAAVTPDNPRSAATAETETCKTVAAAMEAIDRLGYPVMVDGKHCTLKAAAMEAIRRGDPSVGIVVSRPARGGGG